MAKNSKRKLRNIFIVLAILFSLPAITGRSYLYKAVVYNFPNIDDYKIFDNRTVAKGTTKPWPTSPMYNTIILPDSLNHYLESLNTGALVVVKDKELLHEQYWNGYSASSLSNSFSVAKSITGLLIGAAIQDGKIQSVDDPIANYIPSFAEGDKKKITIKHVLTMSSGTNFDESYVNPFSATTDLYYGSNANKVAENVQVIEEPGARHVYKSGDTQLLGMVVENATGKSLSEYASEKLWKPLGASQNALWSIDKKGGNEKAYCCFNSNAPDYARIGQLMLDSGKINNVPVIDSSFYAASITPIGIPDANNLPCDYYGYQWWIYPNVPGIFYARGILGQYIICIPAKQMVIVRLGEKRDDYEKNIPREVHRLVEWGLKL